MDAEDFDVDQVLLAVEQRAEAAYQEIHEEYVRQSRIQAENLKAEILTNILAQNFENAGNSTSPHHKAYVRWKESKSGSPLDLIFTGQLLSNSLIITQIQDHPDDRLIGGYEVTVDESVIIPKTGMKTMETLRNASISESNEAHFNADHPTKAGQRFTMVDLWLMIENAWGKRVKQAAIAKYETEGKTNDKLYERIEKDIMVRHGLSD